MEYLLERHAQSQGLCFFQQAYHLLFFKYQTTVRLNSHRDIAFDAHRNDKTLFLFIHGPHEELAVASRSGNTRYAKECKHFAASRSELELRSPLA